MRMTGYVSFDAAGEDISQDVLIGAYGAATVLITDELARLLKNPPEPADLRLYEERHPVR